MKKKVLRIVSLILVLAVAVGLGAYALASSAEPAVAYDGRARGFTAESALPFAGNRNVDLFTDFKEVMPGDSRTQTIKVRAKNLTSDYVTISLRTEPVQPGESEDPAQANADYEALLSSPYVSLEVYVDGVLKDRDSLAKGVVLGSFSEGQARTVTVQLNIGVEAGNELRALAGMIDWVFTAEEGYHPVPPHDDGLLDKRDHVTYVIGYPDGEVKPGKNITRAEVATIFFRLLTDEARAQYWSKTNSFSDVAYDKWYNNAISTMAKAGIVEGYPDGTFRPNEPITRAEFAAIASRFSKASLTVRSSFSDVEPSYWAYDEISLAEQLGWVNGYPDGTFRPKQDITRAETMTLVNRMLERAVEEPGMLENMHVWPDNQPEQWYYEAVQEATNTHTYVRNGKLVPNLDFQYETWVRLLPDPNWAALEKQWSEANSK